MNLNVCSYAIVVTGAVIFTFDVCLTYQTYTIENSKLCSPIKKNTLKLGGRSSDHAIVVSETRTFDHWSGYKRFSCKFEIKGHRENKIIAVIQKLSFRRDENGNCTDYIQFKSDGEESPKICGIISAFNFEPYRMDTQLLGNHIVPYAFIAYEKRNLDVLIYVDNKKLRPEEELGLEIVFTSAQDCLTASHEYVTCGYNLCILRQYLSDGRVNCPYINCPDEEACSAIIQGQQRSSKVTAGTITAVITSFFLFFGCIWVVRRHHSMCYSSRARGCPRLARMVQAPSEMHQGVDSNCCDEERGQESDQTTYNPVPPGSPPPYDGIVTSAAISPVKDLPPSYESLFSTR